MRFSPAKQDTIIIPSGPGNDPSRPHLFVICTDPCGAGNIVLVPVCKWINHLCDSTCKLRPGVHKKVRVESYIMYRKARIETANTISQGVKDGEFVVQQPMNGQTFLQIKNGLCASPQTPRKVKFYLQCPGFVSASSLSTPAKPDALRRDRRSSDIARHCSRGDCFRATPFPTHKPQDTAR